MTPYAMQFKMCAIKRLLLYISVPGIFHSRTVLNNLKNKCDYTPYNNIRVDRKIPCTEYHSVFCGVKFRNPYYISVSCCMNWGRSSQIDHEVIYITIESYQTVEKAACFLLPYHNTVTWVAPDSAYVGVLFRFLDVYHKSPHPIFFTAISLTVIIKQAQCKFECNFGRTQMVRHFTKSFILKSLVITNWLLKFA